MNLETQRKHKVEVFDLDNSSDRELYTETLSNPKVEVVANETHITKANEKILVVKYTQEEEVVTTDDFKTPILGM